MSANAQSTNKPKEQNKGNANKTQTNTTKPTETDGLTWYNWNDGYPLAVKKNKILLVDIYTTWCGWCKKMDRDTYSQKSVIDMINKDFIAVKFNPEITVNEYDIEGAKYNNSQLFAMLCNNQRVGYPTTVFIYTDTKKIDLFSGYQDEANFKKTLEQHISLKGK